MNVPPHIQQLIDAGIAHYDMDGAVVLNAAYAGGGGWRGNMPAIQIQINNTYNTYNFYGDNATNNDIHENTKFKIH